MSRHPNLNWLRRPAQRCGLALHRRIARRGLADCADRYARHGWDIVPGAFYTGQRFDCGRPGCRTVECHPAMFDWESRASHDSATVAAWWHERPYTVLLATGRSFDVLEVPAALGTAVSGRIPLRAVGGPIATTPEGRWMFLVRTGFGLAEELARRADVVLHGPGSWVPAPPFRHRGGQVVWRQPPRRVGYRLADPILIQSMILAAVGGHSAPDRRQIAQPA